MHISGIQDHLPGSIELFSLWKIFFRPLTIFLYTKHTQHNNVWPFIIDPPQTPVNKFFSNTFLIKTHFIRTLMLRLPKNQEQFKKKSSQTLLLTLELTMIKIQLSIIEISIEIKTATAVIKNELKCFPMPQGNTCIADPNLEVLPLI